MRLTNDSDGERVRLSPFLWCFLFLGILLSAFADGGSSDSFFQTSILSAVKTGNYSVKGFFLHVLFLRLSYMVGILILSTTALKKFFLVLQPFLLCLGMGAWIGAAITGYGIKGIVLVLVGAFPHMLIYILVLRFLLMLLWDRTHYDKQFFIAVFILFFMVIIGCLFESYVNPIFVAKILKIF